MKIIQIVCETLKFTIKFIGIYDKAFMKKVFNLKICKKKGMAEKKKVTPFSYFRSHKYIQKHP